MVNSREGMSVGCIDGSVVATSAVSTGVRLRVSGAADQAVELSAPAAAMLIGHLATALAESASRQHKGTRQLPHGQSPDKPAAPKAAAPPAGLSASVSEKVADLIDAGLLVPGSDLAMKYHGDYHFATVADDGRLIIGDGAHGTPSGAAKSITGGSVDGWTTWRVASGPDEGRTLADLRWRLRAHRFPPSASNYAAATRNQKHQLALRWVDYALSHGLDPGTPDPEAVEDLLSAKNYSASTRASYRQHLQEWFQHRKDATA